MIHHNAFKNVNCVFYKEKKNKTSFYLASIMAYTHVRMYMCMCVCVYLGDAGGIKKKRLVTSSIQE